MSSGRSMPVLRTKEGQARKAERAPSSTEQLDLLHLRSTAFISRSESERRAQEPPSDAMEFRMLMNREERRSEMIRSAWTNPNMKSGQHQVETQSVADTQLVGSAKQGDPDAFEELVKRHTKRVFSIVWHITRSREDAEDG